MTFKPGLSAIEEARFAHAVRFEEGALSAQAAAARYDLDKGTLELSGAEPGLAVPHVINQQIVVDAVTSGNGDVTVANTHIATVNAALGALTGQQIPVP